MSLHTGALRTAIFPRSTALTEALFIVGGIGFLALLAQISLPIPGSPVPVTGQTLGVLLIGTTYGARLGVMTFGGYLLAGMAGPQSLLNRQLRPTMESRESLEQPVAI